MFGQLEAAQSGNVQKLCKFFYLVGFKNLTAPYDFSHYASVKSYFFSGGGVGTLWTFPYYVYEKWTFQDPLRSSERELSFRAIFLETEAHSPVEPPTPFLPLSPPLIHLLFPLFSFSAVQRNWKLQISRIIPPPLPLPALSCAFFWTRNTWTTLCHSICSTKNILFNWKKLLFTSYLSLSCYLDENTLGSNLILLIAGRVILCSYVKGEVNQDCWCFRFQNDEFNQQTFFWAEWKRRKKRRNICKSVLRCFFWFSSFQPFSETLDSRLIS